MNKVASSPIFSFTPFTIYILLLLLYKNYPYEDRLALTREHTSAKPPGPIALSRSAPKLLVHMGGFLGNMLIK